MTGPKLHTKDGESIQAADCGAKFMAAREAAGLSRADVAARLNLTISYIEFIETEQFERLPTATFTKGYIRNYAKCLALSEAAMLERYQVYVDGLIAPDGPFMRVTKQVKPSDPVVKGVTVAILVVVLALSTLWWRTQQDQSGVTSVQGQGLQENTLNPTTEGLQSARDEKNALPLSAVEESLLGEATDASPMADMQESHLEIGNVEEVMSAENGNAPTIKGGRLMAVFNQDSWIEVKDGNGRRLYTGTKKAGERLQLITTDIFDLVVGNPAALELTYNDAPVDLTEYIDRRATAKFKLQ